MRLRSILLFVLSCLIFSSNSCLNKNEINIESEINYQKKVPQSESSIFAPVISLFSGIQSALVDNFKNILRSFLYPIESIVRVFKFCYRICSSFVGFIIYPKTDDFYISSIDSGIKKISDFFGKMNLEEKCKWFGYVITDLLVGYFAPAGLGWKAVSMSRSAIMSVKGIKYIDNLNRFTNINLNILRVIDNSSSVALLNVKYGFEYLDQFKQYFNDVFRHD